MVTYYVLGIILSDIYSFNPYKNLQGRYCYRQLHFPSEETRAQRASVYPWAAAVSGRAGLVRSCVLQGPYAQPLPPFSQRNCGSSRLSSSVLKTAIHPLFCFFNQSVLYVVRYFLPFRWGEEKQKGLAFWRFGRKSGLTTYTSSPSMAGTDRSWVFAVFYEIRKWAERDMTNSRLLRRHCISWALLAF